MKQLYRLSLILCAALWLIPAPGRAQQNTPKPRRSHALLVGIGQYGDLPDKFKQVPGAKEDVVETEKFLREQYGFAAADIHCLVNEQATRKRILAEFRTWLIEQTAPGDRVFFLFSGHGSQVHDENGDEAKRDPADHDDEAIVPYDATIKGENFIIDDELEELITRLSGRLGVFVIDSCTSGTISRATGNQGAAKDALRPRYLPSPAQFAALQTNTRGAGGAADYEVQELPPDSKLLVPRNLRLVEEKLKDIVSGLVVISAAQPGQAAFPMETEEGGYRGALSYLFNKIQLEEKRQNRTLSFNQLRDRLTAEIAGLQQREWLRGTQVPFFEVLSKYPLGELPLFVGAQAQVEYALPTANPASMLRVELRTNEDKRQYRIGEDISYTVKTNAPGWLYLLVFSQENVATCIFPTKDNDSYRTAGTLRLPAEDAFEVKEPIGKDITIALLSSRNLKLGDKEVMSWDEVFDRLHSNKLAGFVKTRGVGTKKPGQASSAPASLDDADWQAASLVIETIAKTAGRNTSAKQANARSARGVSPNLNKPKQR